jgi:hypothetical protein
MATTTRSNPASNGAHGVRVKAREAGGSVASVARKAPSPAVAAGAAAAGLAGGLLLGSRLAPRRGTLATSAITLAHGMRRAAEAADKATTSIEEIRRVREQLETLNRRSPVEVLLDGLTHRRGAHRREG